MFDLFAEHKLLILLFKTFYSPNSHNFLFNLEAVLVTSFGKTGLAEAVNSF